MANITTVKTTKFSVAIQQPQYLKLINDTLGDKKVAAQFIADISAVVATNPQLQKCDSGSIVSGALLGHSLKLPLAPTFGFAYLVPYQVYDKVQNAKIYKAQFQMGYKGYIQLAIRTNQYKRLDALPVYKDEYKGRDKELGFHIIDFTSANHANESPVGYFAYFVTNQGYQQSVYMTKEEVSAHAKRYSKSFASEKPDNVWANQFDEMALKTVLRKLISKYGVMSVDFADSLGKALVNDQAIISDDGHPEYIDNDFNELDNEEPTDIPDKVIEDKVDDLKGEPSF